ncbi:MAG: NAD(P)/FAD-dependent oxidoreductase [Eggerthellaceae bacterium]
MRRNMEGAGRPGGAKRVSDDPAESFCDVLVVGAGPAGAAAAHAQAGASVLLVERAPPRNKSCPGMLIEAIRRLRTCSAAVPTAARCVPDDCRGLVMYDQSGRRQESGQKALNVWRDRLDAWMAGRAVDAGATLREATSLVFFGEEAAGVAATLKGAEGAYRVHARYLVLCDGVTGYLRRSSDSDARCATITYQAFCEGEADGRALDPLCFHAFLQPEFSEYDAWANVKDGLLVVGTAVRDAVSIRPCHEAFYGHLQRFFGMRVDRIVRAEKWAMPRVRRRRSTWAAGAFSSPEKRPACSTRWGRHRWSSPAARSRLPFRMRSHRRHPRALRPRRPMPPTNTRSGRCATT